MKFFRKKAEYDKLSQKLDRKLTRTEALAGIPQRSPSATWQSLENGDILIEYPLDIKPFFIQLTKRFQKDEGQRPTKKLQLDNLGSSVWQMFDGLKDVKTIIKEVSSQSGLSLQESEISVTTFLRQLGGRGLILIK